MTIDKSRSESGVSVPKKLRVWSLSTERGWRGGENQVYLLQKALAQSADIDSCLLAREGEELAQRSLAAGLSVRPLSLGGSFDLRAAWRLRRWLVQEQVDILHVHASHAHNLALLATWGLRCKLLVTRRVAFPLKKKWLSQFKYGRADAVVAISQAVRSAILVNGLAINKLEIIADGVDADLTANISEGEVSPALRAEHSIAEDVCLLLCVAAMTEEKGHSNLLDAFAQLPDELKPTHLLLAGDGPLSDALKQRAQELSMSDRVHFLGFRDDVPSLMKAADIFVVPSLSEGLGTVIMDAFFAALPVIASDAGGIPELIDDNENARLYPAQDPVALAKVLSELIVDREQQQSFAAAALQKARKQFAYQHMAQSYIDIYKNM
ncbi:MAG: glycosyltransferase [Planctomycetes bacterium]|nr:glycosyltransferase [Planctomycetota bacterium]